MCRRFLVWPASLIWPQNLVACTLLNTLHAEDDEGSGGMTRYRFYVIGTCCAFVWCFFPCTSLTRFILLFCRNLRRTSLHIPGAFRFFLDMLVQAQYVSFYYPPHMNSRSQITHPSDDVVVNQLFGVVSGLGMGILTFDWNQIAFIGSPLIIPWWAEVHIMIGFVLLYWLVVPLLYYSNVRVGYVYL